jgi:hypothetical protein
MKELFSRFPGRVGSLIALNLIQYQILIILEFVEKCKSSKQIGIEG